MLFIFAKKELVCGITGIYSFNGPVENQKEFLSKAVDRLNLRGPDGNGIYIKDKAAFGHTRLAIIDTSSAASQPFTDETGRYTIVFNGEFYNYREIREELSTKGYNFRSQSDTEVLLKLFIEKGKECFKEINGCFSFAIHDAEEDSIILARDRFGINPLLYYVDDDHFIFGSEMKALMEFNIDRNIDHDSMLMYFQLNYIPPPYTLFKNVFKLEPASYIEIKNNKVSSETYFKIDYKSGQYNELPVKELEKMLVEELDSAVERRMVSDVPLGAFLSGGIDSSVIVAMASKYTDKLNTFSIGYKDEPFFDETKYAELVSKRYNTEHTTFKLSNDDLFDGLYNVLDYIDEPFADSSALAVFILSKHTRNKVTVALSGDGADELFAGYYKHQAHLMASKDSFINYILKFGAPVLGLLPESRNSGLLNKFRQIKRYSEGLVLNEKERYWRWCSLYSQKNARKLLNEKESQSYFSRKNNLIDQIRKNSDFNNILYNDVKMVLPGDMLTKVDLMSMANSLEVRTPFLDHNVVDLAFSIQSKHKIDSQQKKKILQNAFRNHLPEELYNRPKQGFEVPLLKWMRNELSDLINKELLNDELILEQGLFKPKSIKKLRSKLNSGSPGDVHAQVWALIVFQYWWKKYMS